MLVLGATGVTGSIAVQLAKSAFGAGRVVVAGRDTSRLDWLRTVGADDAIALKSEDLGARVGALHAERPFDAVLDYLWGEPAEQVLAALAATHPAAHYHATRFVQIGSMAGLTMTLPAGILREHRHNPVRHRTRQRACRGHWSAPAPKRYRDCSTWWRRDGCTCAPRPARSPRSTTRGLRRNRRAPASSGA